MSLCSRVSAAAARHAQLLDELEALHFDPKALPKETQLVHDLQEAINSAQNTLDALSQATKQDRESYLERNGNGLRRVMSRFLGANPEKCVKDLELEQKCVMLCWRTISILTSQRALGDTLRPSSRRLSAGGYEKSYRKS